ncbi:hypothetical protein R6Q59_002610 [Mikania micrantha]
MIDVAQPRKVRGRGKNKNLLEKFASNNNKLLELDLDPKGGTHKFVGENASLFIRCIYNEVARVPFHYPSWYRVPEHDKLGIYRTLHNHPPDTQTQEAWEKIIDELFINVDFRKRSVKNASNRSKQLYATASGSRSYAQMRHDDMRETEISSMLKDWKMMHTKKGGGWVNETTKDDWVNILISCYQLEYIASK